MSTSKIHELANLHIFFEFDEFIQKKLSPRWHLPHGLKWRGVQRGHQRNASFWVGTIGNGNRILSKVLWFFVLAGSFPVSEVDVVEHIKRLKEALFALTPQKLTFPPSDR